MIRNGGQLFLPENSTENGGKPQIRYYDNEQFVNLALDEKTGASIDLSIDTSTYVMTVALKNADGTIISSGDIDFPLESVVVNATYENGILTLVLQNGNSVNVDISDIISGLVSDVQANGVSVVSNGVANITKASLGLGNVDNTADVNKVVHGATFLTNQDLDNYKTTALVGWYYAAAGNSVTNKPSGVVEFGLEVMHAANGGFVQRLTFRNKIYQRTYLSPSWSPWKEFAETTGTYSEMTVGKANRAASAANDSNGQKIVDTYAKLTQISNPNLLINPDFSINQRGASSYNTKRQYTCDRWELYSAAGTTYNASTKTFTVAGDGYFWYEQYSEIDAVLLRGKSLTFTLSASGGIRRKISFGYKVDSTKTEIAGKDTTEASTKISVTGTVPNDATGIIYVRIQGFQTTGTITLEWAKLEVGSVATAFIPPLIAEELQKCYRYYKKITNLQSQEYFALGMVYGDGAGARMIVENTFRVSPTISSTGNFSIVANGAAKTVSAMNIQSFNSTNITVKFTLNSALTEGLCGYLQANNSIGAYIDFDAEIY